MKKSIRTTRATNPENGKIRDGRTAHTAACTIRPYRRIILAWRGVYVVALLHFFVARMLFLFSVEMRGRAVLKDPPTPGAGEYLSLKIKFVLNLDSSLKTVNLKSCFCAK